MRAAKWVAGGVAALLLLLGIGVLCVTLLVDPNRFRGRIERLVSETSGQPFQITGDLKVSWYPWLALEMGSARLGADPAWMEWQSARFGARLVPLLKGRLELDRTRLVGVRVRLERGADGQGNWQRFLAGKKDSQASAALPQIGGLEIRAGALDYVDASSGKHLSISEWTLDLGAWRPREPVSLRTKFALRPHAPDGPAIDLTFDAPRIEWRTEPLSASIPKFAVGLANATLTGNVTLESRSPVRARGAVTLKTGSLRALLETLAFKGPRPRDKAVFGPMTLNARWALVDGALAVKPLDLHLDETALRGELTRPAGAGATLRVDLQGDRIALDRYVELENQSPEPFELPVATLKSLQVTGVLSFAEARMAGAWIQNARIRLETP